MLGTVFVQFPAPAQVVIVEDDFNDPAGTMASPGTPPNTDPAWRWTEESTTPNTYTGASILSMPMESSGGFDQYIDADVELVAGHAYAYVIVLTLPINAVGGDQQLGFAGNLDWRGAVSDPPASNQRGFYVSGANIGFSDSVAGPNGGLKLTWVGQSTFVNDTVQSLMIRVSETGVITTWHFDGDLRDPNSGDWFELTDRTDVFPDNPDGSQSPDLFQMEFGPNVIGVQHFYGVPDRTGGFCLLDYIALFDMSGETPNSGNPEMWTIYE
jgi:hypothetical protein